jgi:hypothetical protein
MEGRKRRLRWPFPHHPLLLIASRSVETKDPGAKAPGFFVSGAYRDLNGNAPAAPLFGLRTRPRGLTIAGPALRRAPSCVRADAFRRSCKSRRILVERPCRGRMRISYRDRCRALAGPNAAFASAICVHICVRSQPVEPATFCDVYIGVDAKDASFLKRGREKKSS